MNVRWRVTEISQILLILVDSRCPSLHFPPSLALYLKDRKIILVLTKVDITGPERTEAWKSYLRAKHPDIPIVEVESYVKKEQTAVHQGKHQFESSIPENFRVKLIEAIKKVHAELLEPPEEVKERPERLKNWVPPVKPEVDWDAVISAKGDRVGLAVGGPAVPRPEGGQDDGSPDSGETGREGERSVPEVLTIGLIGGPLIQRLMSCLKYFSLRSTQCWKVIPPQRPLRHAESDCVSHTRKGTHSACQECFPH